MLSGHHASVSRLPIKRLSEWPNCAVSSSQYLEAIHNFISRFHSYHAPNDFILALEKGNPKFYMPSHNLSAVFLTREPPDDPQHVRWLVLYWRPSFANVGRLS